MSKPDFTRWFWVLTRVALGCLFLYAGFVKAGASERFALTLAPFTIISGAWTQVFAIGLALTEIAAGLLILLPRVHRIGSVLILLLSFLFIGVLTWALANNIIVSCGCFGRESPPSASAMLLAILRDVVISAAAGFALVFRFTLPAFLDPDKWLREPR